MAIDARNEFGETGLMLAAEQGHFETAKILLSSKADANAKDLALFKILMESGAKE